MSSPKQELNKLLPLQFSAAKKPAIPSEKLFALRSKKGDLIIESLDEILFNSDPAIQQCFEVQGEGQNRFFKVQAGSAKIVQEAMTMQDEACKLGTKKYEDFLSKNYSEESIRFMEEFDKLVNNAMYTATDAAKWDLLEFLFSHGYSAAEGRNIFNEMYVREPGYGRQGNSLSF